jgi:hypothetical protein
MNNFKRGDKVRLIDTNNLQQEDRVYAIGDEAVVEAAWKSNHETTMIKISINGYAIDRAFYSRRFVLADTPKETFIKELQMPPPGHDLPIRSLTLPTDSADRKNYPLAKGLLEYFPAALSGVAKISKYGNDKHNPGQPLHHARGKSTDHSDCIVRHLIDTADLLAAIDHKTPGIKPEAVLNEVSQMAWRALALSQEIHEMFGAPMAPGAVPK